MNAKKKERDRVDEMEDIGDMLQALHHRKGLVQRSRHRVLHDPLAPELPT